MTRELENVLASEAFDAPRRLRELLRFVVLQTAAGRGDSLTSAVIGERILGPARAASRHSEAVLRLHADRLRRALARHYRLAGPSDCRIELPKGSLVPVYK